MNAFHLFVLLPIIAAQEADITIPPRAVNVSINEVVEFNCTAVANGFTWYANGQQIDNGEGVAITPEIPVNEKLNIRMSTLRMAVVSVNNSTNITCIAFLLTPISSEESNPALLLVQGLLGPVSNLTVTLINSTTVLISWSPPFTLEGVPILGYNVTTITNTTSGENETMSVEGDTTMLYYSIDHPDPDNNFTVTVVPINGAGPGEDAITFFSFSFVSTTSVLTSTSIFQTTRPSSILTPTVSTTATVSVRVTPSPMGPTGTDSSLGPIIGWVIGGVILFVLVMTLCAVVIICVIQRPHMSRHNSDSIKAEPEMASDSNGDDTSMEELGPKEYHAAKRPQLNFALISSTKLRANINVVEQERQVPCMVVDIAQISQQVAQKWRWIGLQLEIHSKSELDQIAYVYQSLCCSELFMMLAAKMIRESRPFTWKGVIEALDSSLVSESSLARDLESTYYTSL